MPVMRIDNAGFDKNWQAPTTGSDILWELEKIKFRYYCDSVLLVQDEVMGQHLQPRTSWTGARI